MGEGINVKSVSHLARHTSRRGVRLFKITESLELRHLVSDRGGGTGDLLILRQKFGSDRFAGFNMCFDKRFKYPTLALTEFISEHNRPP